MVQIIKERKKKKRKTNRIAISPYSYIISLKSSQFSRKKNERDSLKAIPDIDTNGLTLLFMCQQQIQLLFIHKKHVLIYGHLMWLCNTLFLAEYYPANLSLCQYKTCNVQNSAIVLANWNPNDKYVMEEFASQWPCCENSMSPGVV